MIDGKKVLELCHGRGWSGYDLARAAGCTQATVEKITSGKTRHSRYLLKIAQALEVDPEWATLRRDSTDTVLTRVVEKLELVVAQLARITAALEKDKNPKAAQKYQAAPAATKGDPAKLNRES